MDQHHEQEQVLFPSLDNPERSDSGITYVSELTGPDDAWITPPEIVRLTGCSGSMPYCRINAGQLPVRGDPKRKEPYLVGMPKRTMQCRLSDVLLWHTPLSADLVKSPALRTLDLPQIPTEMARLSDEQQKVMEDARLLQEAYGELKVLVDETVALFRQELQTQKETLGGQIQELQKVLTLRIEKAEQHVSLFLKETTSRLQQITDRNDQTDREMERLENAISEVRQLISQAQNELKTAFQKVLTALKLEIEQQRADQEYAFLQRIQLQADALAREVDERTKRIEGLHAVFDQEQRNCRLREKQLDERQTELKDLLVSVQQTQESQARGVQDLTLQLQAEQQARRALEKLWTTQDALLKQALAQLHEEKQARVLLEKRGTEQDTLLKQVSARLEEEKQARQRLSRQLQVLVQASNASHLAEPLQEKPSRERKSPE